ncbi:MAG TPA: magnesium/cobalt transporter CorA [Bacteroidia bacterium]|nr:magnesium/cobalt transporter CorA [Bacteroidia bacterium]
MSSTVEEYGLPPGTLSYVGRETTAKVVVTILEYNEFDFSEVSITDIEPGMVNVRGGMIRWINVEGVHDTALVEKIGQIYDIHPLTLEDIVNTNQRPKFEEYDHYLVNIMKMVYEEECDKKGEDIFVSEQLTILLMNKRTVISFQEADGGDVFDIIRTRIRQGKGRIRKMGADYLAYCLIDAVVDSYFEVLEHFGDEMEKMEASLVGNPRTESMRKLHDLKRQMIFLRKSVWPMRDMVNNIQRSESELITAATYVYLRDAHDHIVRVIDTVETYRDLLSGMMDLYMSSVSNRMNEVMKTLTIITTIFVPLTFIVGVYGMNFDFMPELRTEMGYYVVWLVMIVIVVLLFVFFRIKKWL